MRAAFSGWGRAARSSRNRSATASRSEAQWWRAPPRGQYGRRAGCQIIAEPLGHGVKIGGAVVARLAVSMAAVTKDAEDFHLIQGVVAFVIGEIGHIEVQAIPHRNLMPPP